MKKLFILSTFLVFLFSACQDELNVDALTNYPPAILSVSPKTSVRIGEFKIKVMLADGVRSPLKSGIVTLKDEDGNELYTITKSLTGISDSIVVASEDFNSSALDYGNYTINVKATDSDNQVTESVTAFAIVDQLYPANNSKMFVAGVFNGWGAAEMTLVSDFTWEIKNIDLQGAKFKFKNTTDWTDADWGDPDCNGLMDLKGSDTDCGYSDLVNIRFNDETLKYTITPVVTFKTNLKGLFILGDINAYQGTKYKFKLVSDHSWELEEIRLKAGNQFKFSEDAFFSGKNYGDPELDGKADVGTPFIVLPETYEDAYYKITFNDATDKYQITFVRYPFPPHMYLVGTSLAVGYNNESMVSMFRDVENGFKFTYTGKFTAGEIKILGDRGTWQPQYGKGTSEGVLAVNDGTGSDPNAIVIAADGYYTLTIDVNAKTYSVVSYDASGINTYITIGIIGTATPNLWDDPDTDLTQDSFDPHQWYIDGQSLKAGEIKFRAEDGWTSNWGSSTFPFGVGVNGGDNIPVGEDADYLIRFCDITGQYAIIKK